MKHYDKSNWQKIELGKIGTIVTGSTPSRSNPDFWGGDFCWITAIDFQDKYIFTSQERLSTHGKKVCRVLPPNTILVTCIASIGLNAITKCESATNQQINAIVCDTKSYNPEFVYYAIESSKFDFINLASKTAVPIINKTQFEKFCILVPDLREQTKIADQLSKIDEHISNLEALISKQEAIKKTTEFLLLQPKDNWNKVKLGEVVEYYKGNGLSKEKLSSKGTYPCILYGELFTRYTEIINSVYSKTVFMEGVASCDGDVLMPGSTTTCGEDLAKASAITQDNVLLGGDVIILRPNKKRLDGRFLAYLISQYKKELIKYTQGITIIHLQGNKMLDMVISIPDLETQRSTINHIVAIDKELEHLRSELDKYRNIKKGLMDYFFG